MDFDGAGFSFHADEVHELKVEGVADQLGDRLADEEVEAVFLGEAFDAGGGVDGIANDGGLGFLLGADCAEE